jgi:hypothetical protein
MFITNYKNKDLDQRFRTGLKEESEKVLTYPFATKVLQDVAKEIGASAILGIGDFFNRKEDGSVGHIEEYKNFRNNLGKFKRNVTGREYSERTKQVDSFFNTPPKVHRDYDIIIVNPNDYQGDRESDRVKILNVSNSMLREEIKKQPLFESVMSEETPYKTPFSGFDLNSSYVIREKEFNDKVIEHYNIALAFPYGINYNVLRNSANIPIKAKSVEKGTLPEGIRIFTEPEIPIKADFIQTPSSDAHERKVIITITPSHRLAEPHYDLLERGRGAVIHYENVGDDLKTSMQEHIKLTGLPRGLETQNEIFRNYVEGLISLKIDSGVEVTAKKSLDVLNSLKIPNLSS